MKKVRMQIARIPGLLWRICVSPVTFVALSLLWCLDLGVGSIVAYNLDPQFSAKMDAYPFQVWFRNVAPRALPQSLWVYILVWLTWLLVGSLFLCTVNWFWNRRKWRKGLGEVLVHLGFLLIFTGFVAGSVAGHRIQGIPVALSGSAPVSGTAYTLALQNLEQKRDIYGKVLDTISHVQLLSSDNTLSSGIIRLNHPLIWKSAVIYPRGSREQIIKVALWYDGARIGPLGPWESALLGGDKSLIVQRILQPGEKAGYLTGPAVLVQMKDISQATSQTSWLAGDPGRSRARFFGEDLLVTGFDTRTQGIYDVHTDPGVRLVLPGAVILGLGTLWALAGYLGLIRRRETEMSVDETAG